MAFSIFGKPGPDGKPVPDTQRPGTRPPLARPTPAANDNPATIGGGPGKPVITSSNIPEMMAIENKPLPLMQEIALLYAADYTDAALAMLREAVQEKGATPHFWLMLLDFCQLRGMQKEFEDLAMKYVVKFERSPPPWNSVFSQPEGRRKEKREASDYFVLNRVGEASLVAEIKKLAAFAAQQSSVRLDVGKLKKITAEEAGLLADTLVRLRKSGIAARFNSVNNLTTMLKEAIRTNSTAEYQACWLLLFEIYQRQGQQEEFEELGLEYAVGFEMSPPSWEVLPGDVAPTDTPAAEEEEAVVSDFSLRGVISISSGDQLQQLRNYAAGRDEAHINMAGVQRIDFDALGAFMEILSGLHHASKKVVLFDVNEMLFPLLEACSVNRFAVILRRKAQ